MHLSDEVLLSSASSKTISNALKSSPRTPIKRCLAYSLTGLPSSANALTDQLMNLISPEVSESRRLPHKLEKQLKYALS